MTDARMRQGRRPHLRALLVALLASAVVAVVGGIAAASAADQYRALELPAWAPPTWLFGPVWTVLYIVMAVAVWLVWRAEPRWVSTAVIGYTVQLVLNMIWTPLFFGAELRGLALVDIVALDVVLVVVVAAFWRRSRVAALMMLPYLAWALFATALTAAVWSLN